MSGSSPSAGAADERPAAAESATQNGGRTVVTEASRLVTGSQQPVPAAWVRVGVVSPTGAVDVSLPLSLTVADVVEELVTSLVPGAPLPGTGPWHLHRLGGPPLSPTQTLGASQPVDGEVLHLTAGAAVPVALAVDDALTALSAGVAAAGSWTITGAGAVLAAATVALGGGAGLVALLLGRAADVPAPLPALALAIVLIAAAARLRRDGGDVVALASLPVWACAGLAVASAHGSDAVLLNVLVGAGFAAIGGLAALAAVPRRSPWWLGTSTAGALTAGGTALVTGRALTLVDAAAVVGVVLVAAVGVLPHLVARSALWSSDAPAGRPRSDLVARGRSARAHLTGLSVGIAVVVAASGIVLVLAGPLSALVLGLALATVVGLRARRSRFVVESAALMLAGALPLAAGVARLAVGSPGQQLWAMSLAALALGGAVALLVVVRRAARGQDGVAQRLVRPRVRRSLDVAEAVLAVAVLPLLGWLLGVYSAAADAGAAW